VKEQLGHASIQTTIDIYGHLVPGADVSFVDRLDAAPIKPGEDADGNEPAATALQPNANQVHPPRSEAD
jgi:hypothetical protein